MIMWKAAAALAVLVVSGAAVAGGAVGPTAEMRPGPSFAQWHPLVLTGENTPPSSMLVNGWPTGYQTDKMHALLQRAGVPYRIDIVPWKRAYVMAQREPYTCVYSTTRTPEREKQFKWIGPINSTDWMLLGRAGQQYRLRSLDDARSLRIGAYNGDARGEYLRDRGFNVDATQNDMANQQKLLLNRIDLWAVSVRADSNMLERLTMGGKIVPVLTFNKVQLYLACNPSVPDAMVDRLNATFDTLRRDGTLSRIDRDYNDREDRPTQK